MAEEERRPDEETADGGARSPEPSEEAAPEAPGGEQSPEAPEDAPRPAPGTAPADAGGDHAPEGEAGGEDEDAEPAPERPARPAEAEGERRGRRGEEGGERAETVPGAELEPIAVEPERELSAEERARLEAEAEERARREAEATADDGEEPAVRREAVVEIPADSRIQATGKRKSSIARVLVRAGSGRFEVNRRELDEYFPRESLQSAARQPLVTAGYEGSVDVSVRVHGGGVSSQAGAVRHGIARALCEVDPELRGELKRRGLLTRDARAKERRKAGLKKARKRPQFSKR